MKNLIQYSYEIQNSPEINMDSLTDKCFFILFIVSLTGKVQWYQKLLLEIKKRKGGGVWRAETKEGGGLGRRNNAWYMVKQSESS